MGGLLAADRPVRELAAQYGSSFANMKGMRVHYRDVGNRADPTPIVLIHGVFSFVKAPFPPHP